MKNSSHPHRALVLFAAFATTTLALVACTQTASTGFDAGIPSYSSESRATSTAAHSSALINFSSMGGTSSTPGTNITVPLTLGTTWVEGSINAGDVVTYTATVAIGTNYTITWNDGFEGDGTMTADIEVSAYDDADLSNYYFMSDSGWDFPKTILASTTTLVIVVQGYASYDAGTYALQVVLAAPN
jgi:hypothetical protein